MSGWDDAGSWGGDGFGDMDVFGWLMNSEDGGRLQGVDAAAESGSSAPSAEGYRETPGQFSWADGILRDSPRTGGSWQAPTGQYPAVAPLTNDMHGAMNVVMGGAQTNDVSSAMYEFATEAAMGQQWNEPYPEQGDGSFPYEAPASASSPQVPPVPQGQSYNDRGFSGEGGNQYNYQYGQRPQQAGGPMGPQGQQPPGHPLPPGQQVPPGQHSPAYQRSPGPGPGQQHGQQQYPQTHFQPSSTDAYSSESSEFMGKGAPQWGSAPGYPTNGLDAAPPNASMFPQQQLPHHLHHHQQQQQQHIQPPTHLAQQQQQQQQQQQPHLYPSNPHRYAGPPHQGTQAQQQQPLPQPLSQAQAQQQQLQGQAHGQGQAQAQAQAMPAPNYPGQSQFEVSPKARPTFDSQSQQHLQRSGEQPHVSSPSQGLDSTHRGIPTSNQSQKVSSVPTGKESDKKVNPADSANGSSASSKPSSQHIARLERNRQAVRDCRRRKREYAQKLQQKAEMLEKENARLEEQLQLGSEQAQEDMKEKCNKVAANMRSILKSPNGKAEEINALVEVYLNLHVNQCLNREEAAKHIVSRLLRQIEPKSVVKMYLWQTAQETAYFKKNSGLWQELKSRLDLTEDQLVKIRKRRNDVLEMCRDIAQVLSKLDALQKRIITNKQLSRESTLFKCIANELEPEQVAKFVSFVHSKVETDQDREEWSKYLKYFDKEIHQKGLNKAGDWVVHNPGSREVLTSSAEEKTPEKDGTYVSSNEDELLHNRHKSAIVLKELFEQSEENLMAFAKAAFAPDIELYDPNTARVINGIEKVLIYIRRIRISFEGLSAQEDSFMTRQNVARGRWTLTGTYFGFKRHPSAAKKPALKTGLPQKPEGKKVTFKVVIAYKFLPQSAQIQSLLVSWAALDVMRQLSLLPESYEDKLDPADANVTENKNGTNPGKTSTLPSATEATPNGSDPPKDATQSKSLSASEIGGTPQSRTSQASPSPDPMLLSPLPKLDRKLKEQKCINLTKIFTVDTPEERLEIANDLLDDTCVFQDLCMGGAVTGPHACIDYIRRLRRALQTMEMTRHNFTPIQKRKRTRRDAAPANEKDSSDSQAQARMQMGCLVKGLYAGALADKPRDYSFNVTIFVTFSSENNKIIHVEVSWNATSLMRQLGILT